MYFLFPSRAYLGEVYYLSCTLSPAEIHPSIIPFRNFDSCHRVSPCQSHSRLGPNLISISQMSSSLYDAQLQYPPLNISTLSITPLPTSSRPCPRISPRTSLCLWSLLFPFTVIFLPIFLSLQTPNIQHCPPQTRRLDRVARFRALYYFWRSTSTRSHH